MSQMRFADAEVCMVDLDDVLFRFEQISDETAEQDSVAINQGASP